MATFSKTLLAPGFEATDLFGLYINGTNFNDTLFGPPMRTRSTAGTARTFSSATPATTSCSVTPATTR